MKAMSRVVRLSILITLVLVPSAYAVEEAWIEKWRADLEFLDEKLPEIHPAPGERLEEFRESITRLGKDLPELEQHEITVRLLEAVASVGDGHTRLTLPLAEDSGFMRGHSTTDPPAPEVQFHTFPVRLGIYEEGVFVERIAGSADLAGARVLKIGGRSVEEAISLVTPTIRHDNQSQLLGLLPMHLVTAEILHARGVTAEVDRAMFEIEKESGEVRAIELSTETGESEWFNSRDGRESPLSHRFLAEGRAPGPGAFTRNHWIEWLPESGVLYFQYNEVLDGEQQTVNELAGRLREMIERYPVDRLIIDIRYNPGGNNSLNQPVLHALIASDSMMKPGRVFVLIGRGTFSAAMMFAVDLERHVAPVFVGEPTGSSPNHFGDSRKTILPNTGLTVRISTLAWQYSDPRDERASIVPHIRVPVRRASVVEGTDPALELLLDSGGDTPLEGFWSGVLSVGRESYPLTTDLAERRGGWEATIRLEAAELEADSDVDLEDDLVRFTLPTPQWTIDFTGRQLGSVIAGHAVARGREGRPYAFALRR